MLEEEVDADTARVRLRSADDVVWGFCLVRLVRLLRALTLKLVGVRVVDYEVDHDNDYEAALGRNPG